VSVLEHQLAEAAVGVTRQAAGMGWRGPDAYDGLWWNWPAPLVAGRRRRQALLQIHARSPFDVRKLYRRRHPMIPKALGIFGSVGLRAHALTREEEPRRLAFDALEVLASDDTASPRAWGYHWDMQTRWSFYRAGCPNAVVTAFGAGALLESHRDDFVARARDAARWVLEDLWIEPEGYFAYHPGRPANVHNANLLGAWIVHLALPGDSNAREHVARAVETTLRAQNRDGSWPYGEGPSLSWVDSFHSGYVLTCLDRLRTAHPGIEDAVTRGAHHFRQFFDDRGRAKLWVHRAYPEDAHAAGTGLTTLAALHRRGEVERSLLERVAARVLDKGIRGSHAVYRRYWWGRTTVTYIRWADAHVALGMVDAASALAGMPDPAPQPDRVA
jgi:hypothetical protein